MLPPLASALDIEPLRLCPAEVADHVHLCAMNMSLHMHGPFVQLPDDIICEFFHVAAEIDPPRGPRSQTWQYNAPRGCLGWILLTHVCRTWREIGLSQSVLWARVVSVFPPDIKAIISRAKDTPLALDFTFANGEGRKLWTAKATAEVISRARSYKDDGGPYEGPSFSPLTFIDLWKREWDNVMDGRTLTLLKDLQFCGLTHTERRWGMFFAHLPSPLEAPGLRRLTVDFPWPICAQSLRTFCAHGSAWRWQLVVQYVESFPLLEELNLDILFGDERSFSGVYVHYDDQSDGPTHTMRLLLENAENIPSLVRLSHLKSLTFIHAGNEALELLRHLQYPEDTSLRVGSVGSEEVLISLMAHSESLVVTAPGLRT